MRKTQVYIDGILVMVEDSLLTEGVKHYNTDMTVDTASQTKADNEIRISEIDKRLAQIDTESVRPLRAINSGSTDSHDIDKLASLDTEAETLRTERAT